VKEFLRGFAVSEGFLELLFDFPTDGLELLAFIDIRHVFGKNVDTRLFKNRSRRWYFVLINLMGLGYFGDDELVCAAFD
jgi:hypothetical protein